MRQPPQVTIFSKAGCSLCDKAKELLLKVKAEIPFQLQEVDITRNRDLFEKYRYVIPVVAIDGNDVMVSKVSELRFRRALAERR